MSFISDFFKKLSEDKKTVVSRWDKEKRMAKILQDDPIEQFPNDTSD